MNFEKDFEKIVFNNDDKKSTLGPNRIKNVDIKDLDATQNTNGVYAEWEVPGENSLGLEAEVVVRMQEDVDLGFEVSGMPGSQIYQTSSGSGFGPFSIGTTNPEGFTKNSENSASPNSKAPPYNIVHPPPPPKTSHHTSTLTFVINGTPPYPIEEASDQVIVRAEEVFIIVLVLMIWVAAIALFFNRWGKIRMLEPYQPKFQQQHRSSCPMPESHVISPQVSVHSESERLIQRMKPQRMSFSKYNVIGLDSTLYSSMGTSNPLRRPRQNSVCVGSTVAIMNPPRRAKSAMDIQHLMLNDFSPGSLSGCSSLLPMANNAKRPSITLDMPGCNKHRSSVVLEPGFFPGQESPRLNRPLGSQSPSPRVSRAFRRPSCLIEKPSRIGRHRHFISFDQPTTSFDRRTSITIERAPKFGSVDKPSFYVEPPSTVQEHPPISISELGQKVSSCPNTVDVVHKRYRRPSIQLEHLSPGHRLSSSNHRLSLSLDTSSRLSRRSSDTRSLRNEPASTSLDETKIHVEVLPENIQVSNV